MPHISRAEHIGPSCAAKRRLEAVRRYPIGSWRGRYGAQHHRHDVDPIDIGIPPREYLGDSAGRRMVRCGSCGWRLPICSNTAANWLFVSSRRCSMRSLSGSTLFTFWTGARDDAGLVAAERPEYRYEQIRYSGDYIIGAPFQPTCLADQASGGAACAYCSVPCSALGHGV